MRWSSMMKVGLSGTSLALAVGCTEPAIDAEDLAFAAYDEAKDDVEAREEEQRAAARERAIRDREDRVADASPIDDRSSWALRPAGDVTRTSVDAPSPEANPSLSNPPPKNVEQKPVVATPVTPTKPKPVDNKKPWGWHRAACGRG